MSQTPRPADTENMLSHIALYAASGYRTFPTNNKVPAAKFDWRGSTVDVLPHVARYPYGQFGVALDDEDLVVDIDPRNMGGRKVWGELKTALSLPAYIEKTFCVRSGSGGVHIYLKKPADWGIKKNLPEYPGIDFLSKGCYVIGAGSMHESGKRYEILAPTPKIAVKDAPAQLLHALSKTKRVQIEVDGTVAYRDCDENVRRFTDFLELTPGAHMGQNGDVTTYKVALRGRENNLTPDKTLELMLKYYNPKCMPLWTDEEMAKKVQNAYRYAEGVPGINDPNVVFPEEMKVQVETAALSFERTASGIVKSTFYNAVMAVTHSAELVGLFRYNLFTDRIELAGKTPWEEQRVNTLRELDDAELSQLGFFFGRKYRADFNVDKIQRAVVLAAQNFSYHPVKDHVVSLEWDGESRIDSWLVDYAGAEDTNFNRVVGRKLLIAMIARIFKPGIKFDHMVVLEGAQGAGKSTLCAILGQQWFGELPLDIKSKDTVDYIHKHWVIEVPEMASVKKHEASMLKAFLVRQIDEMRPAYARVSKQFPRQCVFVGTINPDVLGYLVDTTGNRRYWTVALGRVKIEELRKVRDQLVAEAYNCFMMGKDKLYLDEATSIEASKAVRKREIQDPWMEKISDYIANNPEVIKVKADEIYENVLFGRTCEFHIGHAKRIANCLLACGFEKRVQVGRGNFYLKIRDYQINNEDKVTYDSDNAIDLSTLDN